MNAPIQSAQQEMLKRATFHPIFDGEKNLVAISQLKVETDTRIGKRAMLELLEESQIGDDRVNVATGMTHRQARILATPAPMEAHHLKHSQKYDPQLGGMRDGVTVILPGDVIWTLFERLFENQYSLNIVELTCDSEDVLPVGKDHLGNEPENQPGRIFFARARVEITLHLVGGQTRVYAGAGVAFDHVRMGKMGNTGALNNARRMAEKGAITDAKREALANLGPVFRRAFEDGDEMIEHFEEALTKLITTANRRPVAPSGSVSAAPRAPARREDTGLQTTPEDYVPYAARLEAEAAGTAESETRPGADPEATPRVAPADAVREDGEGEDTGTAQGEDAAPGTVALKMVAPDPAPAEAVRPRPVRTAEKPRRVTPAPEAIQTDDLPDFELPGETKGAPTEVDGTKAEGGSEAAVPASPEAVPEEEARDWSIAHAGRSGEEVLEAYRAHFASAKTRAELDAILECNKPAARKLKGKLLMAMTEAKMAREAEL